MQPVSLDAEIGFDPVDLAPVVLSDTIVDFHESDPSEAAERVLLRRHLESVLDVMPEREASVIRMRFGLDGGTSLTLDEIGVHFGVTRERIRQIETKTFERLREPSLADGLRDYLI